MIGIIGGSGLEDPKILKDAKEQEISTEWGKPSSKIKIGKIAGKDVAILSRHGPKHSIMPTNVPNRANIDALKQLGVTHILASSACGSLRKEIEPGHLIFPDQFIDRTTKRASTFYDKDRVCHLPMAEPFCPELRRLMAGVAKELGIKSHVNKTVITIEGPRFSTRAESLMFRQWGADVINMSTVPECVLAREAGMHYQVVAMSTDYDCFDSNCQAVTIDEVMKVMAQNVENVKKIFLETMPKIDSLEKKCSCAEDIKTSVLNK
ncbi:MAG: S-methyl-5'-thioadenosine phosphorylase [Candidatus Diapherotrites archaeon]